VHTRQCPRLVQPARSRRLVPPPARLHLHGLRAPFGRARRGVRPARGVVGFGRLARGRPGLHSSGYERSLSSRRGGLR
jgi:hypothetical protein